jgi:hypothetical protein
MKVAAGLILFAEVAAVAAATVALILKKKVDLSTECEGSFYCCQHLVLANSVCLIDIESGASCYS